MKQLRFLVLSLGAVAMMGISSCNSCCSNNKTTDEAAPATECTECTDCSECTDCTCDQQCDQQCEKQCDQQCEKQIDEQCQKGSADLETAKTKAELKTDAAVKAEAVEAAGTPVQQVAK